jgi:hypothetical protein
MKLPRPLLWLTHIALFLFFYPTVLAEDWLPISDLNKVVLRSVPAYTAIEAELTGPVETAWQKAHRDCIRYAAQLGGEVQWPVVIVYPEWENSAPEPKTRLLVQLLLPPAQNYPEPKRQGLRVVDAPALVVAACAFKGAYSFQNFLSAKNKIEAYLKEKDIRQNGPPRHLYYSNASWTPQSWRVSEVQIPVAASANSLAP